MAQAQFTQKIPFLVYFDGSVRGLEPGAPVEFRGITVGRVTSVDARVRPGHRQDPHPGGHRDRAAAPRARAASRPAELATNEHRGMAELVRRGLRAQLQSGNLLTGELFVDLTFVRRRATGRARHQRAGPGHPLGAGDDRGAAGVGDRDHEQDRGAAAGAARRQPEQDRRGLETIVNSPDVQQAATTLGATLAQVQQTVGRIDAGATPLLDNVSHRGRIAPTPRCARRRRRWPRSSAPSAPSSALTDDAESVMQELTRAARSIRVFADYLDRHPEALLRGKAGGAGQ